MEFKELGIIPQILKVLEEEMYTNPTPIQEQTIPSALARKDILGLAQTGTGKTAAFSVPILQLLDADKKQGGKRAIRALILTPTRELAIQVHESFTVYGRRLPIRSTVIFGGVGQEKQVNALRGGVDILVATPGRLIDLINQGYVDITGIEFFVLDEADRMLDMGFIHDIRRIMKYLPAKKQTLLFSATMPKAIDEIVGKLLVNPVEVSISPVSSTVDIIEQSVYYVDQIHKIDILTKLLKEYKKEPVLIFTRTKGGADRVVKSLAKKNIIAMAIHGGKSQNARQSALENFKNSEICALVATDIASRGIDINELKYVINYDLPEIPETYVHRIGRTGRAGNEGIAVSFCSFQEQGLLKDIEKLIKKRIEVFVDKEFPMIDTTIKEKVQQKRSQPRVEKDLTQPKRPQSRTRSGSDKDTAYTKRAQSRTKPGSDKDTAQPKRAQSRSQPKVEKETVGTNTPRPKRQHPAPKSRVFQNKTKNK